MSPETAMRAAPAAADRFLDGHLGVAPGIGTDDPAAAVAAGAGCSDRGQLSRMVGGTLASGE